jgi:hypothetical protein
MWSSKTIASIILGAVILGLIGFLIYAALPVTPSCTPADPDRYVYGPRCPSGMVCGDKNKCQKCAPGSAIKIINCPTDKCNYPGITDCWMNTRGMGAASLTWDETAAQTKNLNGHAAGLYGSWLVSGPDDAVSLAKSIPQCKSFTYSPKGPETQGASVWLFTEVYGDVSGDPNSRVGRIGTEAVVSGGFTGVVAGH